MVQKKKQNVKARVQKQHAKMRAFQRYGMVVNSQEYREAVRRIKDDGSTGHCKISNRVTLHIITIAGEEVPVIYDKKRGTIATVLPYPYYVFGEI